MTFRVGPRLVISFDGHMAGRRARFAARSCRGEGPRRRISWSDSLKVRRTAIDTEWPAQEESAQSADKDANPCPSVLDGPRSIDNRTKPLVAEGPGGTSLTIPVDSKASDGDIKVLNRIILTAQQQYLDLVHAGKGRGPNKKADGDGCRDPGPPSPGLECPDNSGFTPGRSATDTSSSSDGDSSLCQQSNLRRPNSMADVLSQAPLASQVTGNRRNRTSSTTGSMAIRQIRSEPSLKLLSTINDPTDQLPNCHNHSSTFEPTVSSQETHLTANDPCRSLQSRHNHSMTHDTDESSSGSHSEASDTHDSSPNRIIHRNRCERLTQGPMIHTTTIHPRNSSSIDPRKSPAGSRSTTDRLRPQFTTHAGNGDLTSHATHTSRILRIKASCLRDVPGAKVKVLLPLHLSV